jgi:hypothetical protein
LAAFEAADFRVVAIWDSIKERASRAGIE